MFPSGTSRWVLKRKPSITMASILGLAFQERKYEPDKLVCVDM